MLLLPLDVLFSFLFDAGRACLVLPRSGGVVSKLGCVALCCVVPSCAVLSSGFCWSEHAFGFPLLKRIGRRWDKGRKKSFSEGRCAGQRKERLRRWKRRISPVLSRNHLDGHFNTGIMHRRFGQVSGSALFGRLISGHFVKGSCMCVLILRQERTKPSWLIWAEEMIFTSNCRGDLLIEDCGC